MKIYSLIALFFTLSFTTALPALAQEPSRWAGIAIQQDAEYLGAPDTTLLAIPLVNWEAGQFFIRSGKGLEEAGAHWQLSHGFAVGSQIAVELGRDSQDSDLLNQLQMPDIPHGLSLGMHLEHSTSIGPAPLYSLLRVRKRSGPDRGALADFRMELGIFGTDTLGLQTYVQATWGDSDAMNSDFGIKPLNASNINSQAYVAAGGLRDTVIGLAGKVDIADDWMLVASVERKRLRDQAAASPIAQKPDSTIITAGVLHRF